MVAIHRYTKGKKYLRRLREREASIPEKKARHVSSLKMGQRLAWPESSIKDER